MKLDTDLPELTHVETIPVEMLNGAYVASLQARNKRQFQAIMEANMYLSVHDEKRAMQVLSQALTS